jgi:hypothetical protein
MNLPHGSRPPSQAGYDTTVTGGRPHPHHQGEPERSRRRPAGHDVGNAHGIWLIGRAHGTGLGVGAGDRNRRGHADTSGDQRDDHHAQSTGHRGRSPARSAGRRTRGCSGRRPAARRRRGARRCPGWRRSAAGGLGRAAARPGAPAQPTCGQAESGGEGNSAVHRVSSSAGVWISASGGRGWSRSHRGAVELAAAGPGSWGGPALAVDPDMRDLSCAGRAAHAGPPWEVQLTGVEV